MSDHEFSTLIDNYILDNVMPSISRTAFMVLIFLLRHQDELVTFDEMVSSEGIERKKTYQEIADGCGFGSMQTVKNAIDSLESNGFLMPPDRHGYVYLIGTDIGYYKIGHSNNPQKRTAGLMASTPFNCFMMHTIETDNMRKLEIELHNKFSDQRVRGEWFELNSDDVDYILGIGDSE